MDRSAQSALPSYYSKTFPAFRAGAAATHAAGLGRKRFIDFIEPYACVSAFIPKHGSKRTPSRIENGLCLLSLCKGGGVHVADEYRTVGFHQTCAELVQKIFPPILDLCVNRPGTRLLTRPLRSIKLGFQTAVEALGLDRRQSCVAKGRELSQAQINAYARNRSLQDRLNGRLISLTFRSLSSRHTDIQIPASSGILTEVAAAQFKVLQAKTVPKREPASGEVDLARVVSNRPDLEGNPSQRAAHASAFTPSEPDLPMLPAAARVFLRDLLDCLRRQMQRTLATRRALQKGPKIVAGQEASFALEYLDRKFDPNSDRLGVSVHAYSVAMLSLQNTVITELVIQKRLPQTRVFREELA